MNILNNDQKIVYENDGEFFHGKIEGNYTANEHLYYAVVLENPFWNEDHDHRITVLSVHSDWVKPIDEKIIFADEWDVSAEFYNQNFNWENFTIGEKVYIESIDFEFYNGIEFVLFNGIKNGIIHLL